MVSRRAQGNTEISLASSQTPTQPLAPFPSSTGQGKKPEGKTHMLTEGQEVARRLPSRVKQTWLGEN